MIQNKARGKLDLKKMIQALETCATMSSISVFMKWVSKRRGRKKFVKLPKKKKVNFNTASKLRENIDLLIEDS